MEENRIASVNSYECETSTVCGVTTTFIYFYMNEEYFAQTKLVDVSQTTIAKVKEYLDDVIEKNSKAGHINEVTYLTTMLVKIKEIKKSSY